MRIPIDEVLHFFGMVHSPTTGALVDADSTPTFEVFEETTDTDIGVGGNMTKRTSKTGRYRGSLTASAANGFEAGKFYEVDMLATVGGVSAGGIVAYFQCVPAETVAGVAKVDTSHAAGVAWASGAIVAGTFAADSITAAKLAADVTTELQSGLATAAAVTVIDDFLDTEVAAIVAVTNKLDTALQLDGAVYRFTLNALELAPTGGSAPTVGQIATEVWDVARTESYAAAGAVPTPWQAVMATRQKLMQFSIAGTAVSVYKVDNVTVAFTTTLNSSTAPTSDRFV